jgi:hypothetical protein
MSMKVIAITIMSALCGCAAVAHETRSPAVERLDGHGVSSATLYVEGGSELRFENDDARSHEIYSNDCGEVSSTVLKPGDVYIAQLGAGPKFCHFQDLLTPLNSGYSGTVDVRAPEPLQLEMSDG